MTVRYPLTNEQKAERREQAIVLLKRQLANLDDRDARFSPDLRERGKVPGISDADIDSLDETLDMLTDVGVDTREWRPPRHGGETHNRRRRSEYTLYPIHIVTSRIEQALYCLDPGFMKERDTQRRRHGDP